MLSIGWRSWVPAEAGIGREHWLAGQRVLTFRSSVAAAGLRGSLPAFDVASIIVSDNQTNQRSAALLDFLADDRSIDLIVVTIIDTINDGVIKPLSRLYRRY